MENEKSKEYDNIEKQLNKRNFSSEKYQEKTLPSKLSEGSKPVLNTHNYNNVAMNSKKRGIVKDDDEFWEDVPKLKNTNQKDKQNYKMTNNNNKKLEKFLTKINPPTLSQKPSSTKSSAGFKNLRDNASFGGGNTKMLGETYDEDADFDENKDKNKDKDDFATCK